MLMNTKKNSNEIAVAKVIKNSIWLAYIFNRIKFQLLFQ